MKKWGSKIRGCFQQGHNILHGFHRFLLFSTASSTATSTDCFANYLVKSLGFSQQQALSTSTRLTLYTKKVNHFNLVDENANFVVNFFKNHGFNDTHIRKIVSLEPRLLSYNVDRIFKPKFKFLQDQGFSGSDIITVVSTNPGILSIGLESRISPAIHDLRQVLGCDTHVIAVMKKLHWPSFGAVRNCLLPNVAVLDSYGIPIELIRKHLLQKPSPFLRNPEIFKDILVRVEGKLGIPRNSPVFLYGIKVVSGTSEETIESKRQMFKSYGWTDSDVQTFIMKNASCFTFSEASIKKKLDFLMNKLGLKPDYLTSHTALFTCSLEKRILPRHNVLLILKEKCLLKTIPALSNAICMSEPCFFKRFVLPFEEVHDVYAKHTGGSMRMLTQEVVDNVS